MKRVFDERGIEIPFPHQTVYFGVDKSGRAPSARIALEGQAGGKVAAAPGPLSESIDSEAEEPADIRSAVRGTHRPDRE